MAIKHSVERGIPHQAATCWTESWSKKKQNAKDRFLHLSWASCLRYSGMIAFVGLQYTGTIPSSRLLLPLSLYSLTESNQTTSLYPVLHCELRILMLPWSIHTVIVIPWAIKMDFTLFRDQDVRFRQIQHIARGWCLILVLAFSGCFLPVFF